MTVHIDIAKSKATLAEVVDLAVKGETIIIDSEGKRLGEFTFEPSTQTSPSSTDSEYEEWLARAKAKHPFIGAWAHLGPVSDEFLDMWLGPDPSFDPNKKDLF